MNYIDFIDKNRVCTPPIARQAAKAAIIWQNSDQKTLASKTHKIC